MVTTGQSTHAAQMRAGEQLAEIRRQVAHSMLPLSALSFALDEIIAGRMPGSPYDQFRGYLLDAEEMAVELARFDEIYWGHRLARAGVRFDAIREWTGFEHEQRLEDVLVPQVWFGSLHTTVEMWLRVLEGEFPNFWCSPELFLDDRHLTYRGRVRKYAGVMVTPVHLNTLGGRIPDDGRTLRQIRAQVHRDGHYVAHTEALAFLALSRRLVRKQDGVLLPYTDVPGISVMVNGSKLPHFLTVFWEDTSRTLHVFPRIPRSDPQWSTPLLLEE